MNSPQPSLWQQLTETQRQQILAILVQILLRSLISATQEVSHER